MWDKDVICGSPGRVSHVDAMAAELKQDKCVQVRGTMIAVKENLLSEAYSPSTSYNSRLLHNLQPKSKFESKSKYSASLSFFKSYQPPNDSQHRKFGRPSVQTTLVLNTKHKAFVSSHATQTQSAPLFSIVSCSHKALSARTHDECPGRRKQERPPAGRAGSID